MNINILGTIVSSDYDDEFFADWINKGIITPSSRVVSEIDAANEPFDLYINSFGGDVFAGGEIMIAVRKAYAAGKIRRCTVGSLAASMAANIVASLRAIGCDVYAHCNSQLMFHGCYTVAEGGAQHHEDVAESLRNINESVIVNLNKIGINDCRAWFSEGREKWISADDGMKMGLFTAVDAEDGYKPVDAKHTASRLAAFAKTLINRKDYTMKINEVVSAGKAETETQQADVAPVESSEVTTTEVQTSHAEDDVEARVEAMANERFARLQSAHDKMISALKTENETHAKSLALITSERDQLKAELEKLTESHAVEIESIRAQLDAEKKAHEAVTKSALRPVADAKTNSWRDAYRVARRINK